MTTEYKNTVTLTEDLQDVAVFKIAGNSNLTVDISLSNHSAIDQFVILGRATSNAPYRTLFDKKKHYTSPRGVLRGTSGNLRAIAANGYGWFMMDDIEGWESIKIQAAQASGDTTTLTYYGGLS